MQDENFNAQSPSFEEQKPQEEEKESFKSFLYETLKIVIISLIIVIPIRYYVIQPFYVKGQSMEPNYHDQEYLIIDEISYKFKEPARGDVVVLQSPQSSKDFFIKRIVGLPGERVTIKNCQLKIYNADYPGGKKLNESQYLPDDIKTCADVDVTLKGMEYFVMGDNRTSSLDSRSFGPITKQNIVGKTWVRAWPISDFTVFKKVEY